MSNGNRVVRKTFLQCSRCNKRLIERLQNGLFRFIFGGGQTRDGDVDQLLVAMQIHGSIKMRCTRRTCREINIFQYFPHSKSFSDNQSGLSEKSKSDTNEP